MVRRKELCKVCGIKQKSIKSCCCTSCWKNTMPFTKQSENVSEKEKGNLNSFSHVESFMKQINQLRTDDEIDEIDDISTIKCKYMSVDDMNNLEVSNTNQSVLHLNISSLPYHIDDLKTVLSQCKRPFDVIGITETRIKKDKAPYKDISLDGYNYEFKPTESSAGGALIYLSNNINYKCRSDLDIYKSKELESIFVETITGNNNNFIIGCVYKHPSMLIPEYIECYLNPLLEKLSHEKKEVIIMGDYNIDLLNYDSNKDVQNYLDTLCSNSFLPYITLPTRISNTTKTLIDNIFYKGGSQPKSGNLTVDISDHLAQVLFIPSYNKESNSANNTTNYIYRDLKNLNNENFIMDMLEIDWENELKLNNNDANFSLDKFIQILNNTLDKHAPYKTLSKTKLKSFSKPWITQGILKSIKIKNNLYKKYCKSKNDVSKNALKLKFQNYRNLIKTLTRRSKNNYYYQYFKVNKKCLRKTWSGIKEIINLNNRNTSLPKCLIKDNKNITDPVEIANEFNDFFCNIGKKLESKIIKTDSKFDKYLKNPNEKSMFLKPTSEGEVKNLILNLNIHKSSGPSSFPTKILKYIVDIISKPLCDIINMSISNGVFPDIIKNAEIIPVFKNGSKHFM